MGDQCKMSISHNTNIVIELDTSLVRFVGKDDNAKVFRNYLFVYMMELFEDLAIPSKICLNILSFKETAKTGRVLYQVSINDRKCRSPIWLSAYKDASEARDL